MTLGSEPNHERHSVSLITTARSSSARRGRRPSAGVVPSVEYSERLATPIGIRSTRSPTRSELVKLP